MDFVGTTSGKDAKFTNAQSNMRATLKLKVSLSVINWDVQEAGD